MAGGKVDILINPDFTGFGGKLRAGLSGQTRAATSAGKVIGTALAAGTAVAAVGFKKALDIGIDYQNSLNTLQAVTGATAAQMKQVGATAQALGSDLSLPATSAADAAAAMTELAKGGLSVDQAMTAAKGTLQLAAAAQIDAASAATIQSNALNAFGLSAENAGKVADVLANTANASAVEITDMAQSLQAGGATAHQFGVSIEDTATALGIFGNAGIKGSDAGTLLKSMLLGLVNQSKPAQAALKELGVQAFDAQGKFVGLPTLFDQLRAAAARMTPEQYAAATATAFGSDAARAAGIAAATSAGDWDKMSAAVGKAGGAAQVAAAKSKGLGGAIEGFKSQLETIAIDGFNKVSPALEDFVRKGAEGLPKLADGAGNLLTQLKPVGDGFVALLGSLKPVATGVADIVTAGSGLGPVSTAATVFGGALKIAAAVITPFASAVGGLLSLFSALPGPVQAVATALLLLKVGPSVLGGLVNGFRGAGTAATGAGRNVGIFGKTLGALGGAVKATVNPAFTAGSNVVKRFGEDMKVQAALAKASGVEVSKLGLAQATFATSAQRAVAPVRSFATAMQQAKASAAASGAPITTLAAGMRALGEQSGTLGKIGQAFTTAAAGATRFKTTAGVAAGVGAAVKGGLSSLVGFLGGPWGAALALGGVALSVFAAHQQEAADKAAAHEAALRELSGTLDQQTGAVTESTRAALAKQEADKGNLDIVDKLNISRREYISALLGEPNAIAGVNTQLQNQAELLIQGSDAYKTAGADLGTYGLSLSDVAQAALGSQPAIKKINDAIFELQTSNPEAADTLATLISGMQGAAKPAADLAAQLHILPADMENLKRHTQQAAEASGSFSQSLELVKTGLGGIKDGVVPTTAMSDALKGLATNAKGAAQAAGEQAAQLGGQAAGAEAARAKMEELRQQFINTYVESHKGSATAQKDAEALADKIGLIPAKAGTDFTTNAPEVQKQVDEIKAKVDALPPGKSITIAAPTEQVQRALEAVGLKVEAIPGTKNVKVSVDETAAQAKAAKLKTLLDGIVGVAKADANIAPGTAKGNQLKTYIDGLRGIITADGNIQPGTDKANLLKTYVDGIIGIITEDGNNAAGKSKADELKAYADALRAQIQVDADVSAAKAQIDAFRRNESAKSIQIKVAAVGGSGTIGRALGGIDVKGYAKGGVAARRMSNLRADIIRPGQYRLIGDNLRYPEAFIPLNPRSRRSQAILEQVLRAMGRYATQYRAYADGGVAVRAAQDLNITRLLNESGALQIAQQLAAPAFAAAGRAQQQLGTMNVYQTIAPRSEVSASAIARESVTRMRHARFTGGLYRR